MGPEAVAPGKSVAARGGAREAARVRQAARDFEALVLGHMLKTMRQASLPGASRLAGHGPRLYREMMDDELAKTLARGGGLGLGDLVTRDLLRRAGTAKKPSSPPADGPINLGQMGREETHP